MVNYLFSHLFFFLGFPSKLKTSFQWPKIPSGPQKNGKNTIFKRNIILRVERMKIRVLHPSNLVFDVKFGFSGPKYPLRASWDFETRSRRDHKVLIFRYSRRYDWSRRFCHAHDSHFLLGASVLGLYKIFLYNTRMVKNVLNNPRILQRPLYNSEMRQFLLQ